MQPFAGCLHRLKPRVVNGRDAIGRRAAIVSIPLGLALLGAAVANRLPGLPRVAPDEIRRLLEDKAFSIGPMRRRLGVEPISLEEGLARTFARPANAQARGGNVTSMAGPLG